MNVGEYLVSCINDVLDYEEIAKIDYDELKKIEHQYVNVRKLKKGEYITKEGVVLSRVLLVVRGEYYVVNSSDNGQISVNGRFRAPQFIGVDRAVGIRGQKMSDSIALNDCIVIEIKQKYFVDLMQKNGDMAVRIIKNICEKAVQNINRINQMKLNDSTKNLAVYIYTYWMERNKDNEKCRIDTKNAIIALNIGVSERTLYRAINTLKDDNLIMVNKGCIEVTAKQIDNLCENFDI